MKQITSICSSQIVVSLGGADYCSNKFPNLINLLKSFFTLIIQLHYMNIHIQYYRNMHNKIHSVISPLFRIKNADTETGWNVQILRSVWIISAEIRYLLSEQKKFQNKSKNIDEVYQSVFFRYIMFLSYRVTFLCNVLGQIHYTHGMKNMHTFFVSLSLKYPHIS